LPIFKLSPFNFDPLALRVDRSRTYVRCCPAYRYACSRGHLFLERLVATHYKRFIDVRSVKRSIVLVFGCRQCAGSNWWIPVKKKAETIFRSPILIGHDVDTDGHFSILGRS